MIFFKIFSQISAAFVERYDLGKVLGAGGFGQVMAATRKKDDLPVGNFFLLYFIEFLSSEVLQGVMLFLSYQLRWSLPENISSINKDKTDEGLTLETSAFDVFAVASIQLFLAP